MQRANFYSKTVYIPDTLRAHLLLAPVLVKKQKRERSVWIISGIMILSLNIGLYLQHETKRQEQATSAVYQYLNQTYYHR